MTPESEVWRSIPGYEGRYEASDQGRVRSVGFYVPMNHANGKLIHFWKKGRVLRPGLTGNGRLGVTLVDAEGAQTSRSVHRLVLLAHAGAPPAGSADGLHRDDNPLNNVLSNLYWGNQSANGHDSVRNGTHVQSRKTACPLGHLLVEPNLVPSTGKRGYRGCLACKKTQASHHADARLRAQGRERTTYYQTKDGFRRRAGESFQDEADRRYNLSLLNYRV